MITSSKFFNKSFIYFEDRPQRRQQQISILKKNFIEPWMDNQVNVIKAYQHQKFQQNKIEKNHTEKIKHYSFRLPSNLLPSTITKNKNQSIVIANYETIKPRRQQQKRSQKLQRLQKTQKLDRKIQKLPSIERPGVQRIKSLSIKQFIEQQKRQLRVGQQQNKKYLTILNEQNESQFLASRHKKRNQYFKKNCYTLDLNKNLITPMRIYQRNQIVKINSESLWRDQKVYGGSLNKYLPLKHIKSRYQL